MDPAVLALRHEQDKWYGIGGAQGLSILNYTPNQDLGIRDEGAESVLQVGLVSEGLMHKFHGLSHIGDECLQSLGHALRVLESADEIIQTRSQLVQIYATVDEVVSRLSSEYMCLNSVLWTFSLGVILFDDTVEAFKNLFQIDQNQVTLLDLLVVHQAMQQETYKRSLLLRLVTELTKRLKNWPQEVVSILNDVFFQILVRSKNKIKDPVLAMVSHMLISKLCIGRRAEYFK